MVNLGGISPRARTGHKGRANLGSSLQPTGRTKALAHLGCAGASVLVMNTDTSVGRDVRELHCTPVYAERYLTKISSFVFKRGPTKGRIGAKVTVSSEGLRR